MARTVDLSIANLPTARRSAREYCRLIACCVLLTIAWADGRGEEASAPDAFDLLIRNGRVIDGSGNPWFRADVGIRGDRIAAIGDLSDATAARVIDARQSVVAPGFIDMHSHASWSYLVDPRCASKVTQGVTLEIEGEGHSVAPMDEAMVARQMAGFRRFGVVPDWRTLGEFFARLEAKPATINFATYVGTGTIRELVVGFDDRPATPPELARMREIADQAMREGALGVYSALMYSPDRYNRTEELIELARVASRYGGVYQTHPRSESDAFSEATDEVFRIAREAAIPAHITHIKVTYQQNWGRMPELIARIEQARAAGLDITADMYPYERAAASFVDLLPPWAQDGGRQAIVRRLRDAPTRERIKEALITSAKDWENEYYGTKGGPSGITLVDGRGNAKLRQYEGMTLERIAAAMKRDPRDALLDIVLMGDAYITTLITNEADIRLAIQQPWVAFGSDGSTVAPDGPLSTGLVHPRTYGAFPRVFGTYVRDLKLVRLEEAVRRATSFPAQRLNIRDRGLLREGYFADVVIFDPAQIRDLATYDKPHQYSKGIHHVLVNGQVVLDDGNITAARPGRVVRGPGFPRTAAAD
ncbi:MAG: N-acyl-D-amino-acid deacylase family protein [Steroidobacteraceae bacterium]